MKKKTSDTIFFVLVLALSIRLIFAFSKSIYHDEAMYLAYSYFAGFNPVNFLYLADYSQFWGGTIFSSLLPLVIDRIFFTIMPIELGVRIGKILAGIGSVYLVYLISKNNKAGLIAASIVAFNSATIFVDFLKFEAYSTFFLLLGCYFLMEKDKRKFSGIAFFASFLMKYSSAVQIIVILLIFLIISKKKEREEVIKAGIITAVLIGTFMMFHTNQLEKLREVSDFYKAWKEVTVMNPQAVGTPAQILFEGTIKPTLIFLSPIIALLVISLREIKKDENLVWLAGGISIVVYLNIGMPSYVFFNQYLTSAVPFFAIIAGEALSKMKKDIVYAGVGIFVIINLLNSFSLIDFPVVRPLLFASPDWRPAVNFLKMRNFNEGNMLATQHAAIWFYLDSNKADIVKYNSPENLPQRINLENKIEIKTSAESVGLEETLSNYKYVIYFSSKEMMPSWTTFITSEMVSLIEQELYNTNYYESPPYQVLIFKNRLLI